MTHLADPRLILGFISFHEDLADLLAGLDDARVRAAVHLVVPLAEQLVAGAKELRIRALVDFPLLQLILRLFVEALDDGEVVVPIPLGSDGVLNKLDAGLDIVRAHLHGLLVLVTHGEAEVEHRHVGEAACKVGGSHCGAVARHGAGNEAGAHVRQRVNDQSAALGGRHRAGVCRQAVGLDRVDVRHAGELVDLRNEEDRQKLERDARHVREARHDLAHGHFVEQNDLLAQRAVAVFGVALGEQNEVLSNVAEDIENQKVRHLECAAAQTHDVLVHKAVAAEVGHHPAVIEHAVHRRDQVLAEGHQQHAPHAYPFIEVVSGVGNAAPLTADGRHGAILIQAAETLLTVEDRVDLLLLGAGLERFQFFLDAVYRVLAVLHAGLTPGFPVGLLEHIPEDPADQLQVFGLRLEIHVILHLEEFRIGVFRSLSHYFVPSSL